MVCCSFNNGAREVTGVVRGRANTSVLRVGATGPCANDCGRVISRNRHRVGDGFLPRLGPFRTGFSGCSAVVVNSPI